MWILRMMWKTAPLTKCIILCILRKWCTPTLRSYMETRQYPHRCITTLPHRIHQLVMTILLRLRTMLLCIIEKKMIKSHNCVKKYKNWRTRLCNIKKKPRTMDIVIGNHHVNHRISHASTTMLPKKHPRKNTFCAFHETNDTGRMFSQKIKRWYTI